MARLSSLEIRKRLLTSAADLQREQIFRTWSALQSARLAVTKSAREHLGSMGTIVTGLGAAWGVVQTFRRKPRTVLSGSRSAHSWFSKAMGLFRVSSFLLQVLRRSGGRSHPGSADP